MGMHRMAGYILFAFAIVVWRRGGKSAHLRTRFAFNAVMAMISVQMVLGIITVLYSAPWYFAIVHQIGAIVAWVLILRARFLSGYPIRQNLREG